MGRWLQTWEGVIYAENYSTGVAATFDAQINIEVDGNYWTVYEACDGVEKNGQPYLVKSVPIGAPDNGMRLAAMRAEGRFLPRLLSSMNISETPGQPYTLVNAKDYYWCAFWWCLGAAFGCAFLGPAAPACFFVGCTAALIGCLSELF